MLERYSALGVLNVEQSRWVLPPVIQTDTRMPNIHWHENKRGCHVITSLGEQIYPWPVCPPGTRVLSLLGACLLSVRKMILISPPPNMRVFRTFRGINCVV